MLRCTSLKVAPLRPNFSLGPDVSFRGEAEVGRAAESAASVESDPERTSACFRRSGGNGPRITSYANVVNFLPCDVLSHACERRRDFGHEARHLVLDLIVRLQPDVEVEDHLGESGRLDLLQG